MIAVWNRAGTRHRAGVHPCSMPSCRDEAAAACPYIDTWGRRCDAALCAHHGVEIGDAVYCRRHIRYFDNLGGRRPPLASECADPFGSRPSLAAWLPRALDDDVRRLLASIVETDPACDDVDVSQVIRATDARSILWETRWRVSGTSPHLSISLTIDGFSDPTLVARVGSLVVMREIPEWLRHHLYDHVAADTDDHLRRQLFVHAHNAMVAALRGGEEIEIELPGWSFTGSRAAEV